MKPLITKSVRPIYRPDIDGLRAIAVLLVVGFHAFPNWIYGGFIGVDIFFVISGYLISLTIFENINNGHFSFVDFYARRIKRIFPSLSIVLIAVLAFGYIAIMSEEFKHLGKYIFSGAAFILNLVAWRESGYFDNDTELKPLAHLWSLGVEEQFYMLWPFMAWLIFKLRTKAVWKYLTILLIIGSSFYFSWHAVSINKASAFYSPASRFWELLSGSVIALLVTNGGFKQLKILNHIRLFRRESGIGYSDLCSFFGLALIFAGCVILDRNSPFPGKWALPAVLGSALIIIAEPQSFINKKLLSNRLLVGVGLISYPLYLWHWPLISFATIMESGTPYRETRIAAILASIVLSWATYKYIEIPIRFGRFSKHKANWLALLMAIIASLGLIVFFANGFPMREKIRLIEKQYADLNFTYVRGRGELCDQHKLSQFRCIQEEGKPTTLIFGDSHAPRIYFGLKEIYPKGTVAVLGGDGGCPPLLNVISNQRDSPEINRCLNAITEPMNWAIHENSIKEIILINNGARYYRGDKFKQGKSTAKNDWVITLLGVEGLKENARVYELALDSTLGKLVLAGKKVKFILDVPELGFDIRGCLTTRPLTYSAATRSPCAVSKSSFMERNATYRAMVDRILQKYPEVEVIDLSEAVCEEDWCYGMKNGNILYSDDNHLSKTGAQYVITKLSYRFGPLGNPKD